jgi:hypothetical protein
MRQSPPATFRQQSDCLQDPRHHLISRLLYGILMIIVCASISGIGFWTPWLNTVLQTWLV